MKLLRMMSTVILYNVSCDHLYFGDKYAFPDSLFNALCPLDSRAAKSKTDVSSKSIKRF